MRAVIERTPRFVDRVFTDAERAYCASRGGAAAQHYAARFAAKEAALKALGTGWSGPIAWRDAEVLSSGTGAPTLLFHGHARAVFTQLGATRAHLSLSHTAVHAIAQVILERLADAPQFI